MVLKKKGGIHIDWVISLAIFIVYILTMFTLIQPGQEEPYSKENLINIIEQNLDKKINYKINKTALYITSDEDKNKGKVTVPGPFPFSGELQDFAIYKEGIRIHLEEIDEVEDDLTFCIDHGYPAVEVGQNLFWIFNSEGKYADNPESESGCSGRITVESSIIGTTETLEGIDQTFLAVNTICSDEETYENLKEEWKFPLNKDFRIYIVDSDTVPYDDAAVKNVCYFAEPYEQADIFVKEKRSWKLSTDGTMTGVIVHMEVW